MQVTYDPGLVALSLAIAILGSFTGLVMTAGIRHVGSSEAIFRVALGSIAVGGAVWAMHFVAVLALILPVKFSYEIPPLVISVLTVVSFTAFAFAVAGWDRLGRYTLHVSAIILGLGIAAMHFMGMSALRGNFILEYSWLGITVAVIIAIQASAVALWFAFRQRGLIDTCVGAIALGLAIASMHYAALDAAQFTPAGGTTDFGRDGISDHYLALAMALTIYSICGLCLLLFAILTFARKAAARRRHMSERRLLA